MNKTLILITVLAIAGAAFAAAKETVHSIELPAVGTELRAGEGREDTVKFCGICHSLDYITMQPRFSRSQWTAEVNKMIKVMGAPIPEGDAKVITDYLVAQYGTGS